MISPEHRQLAYRYGQGEAVRDLCYEYKINNTTAYSIIAEVNECDGVNLRTEHKTNRQQARLRRLQLLQQRYRDGESVSQLALETGLSVSEVHQKFRHGLAGKSVPVQRVRKVSPDREEALRASAADLLQENPEASIEVLQELMRSPHEHEIIQQIWMDHHAKQRVRRAESFVNQYLEGMTLEQVGQEHGISRERVRQVIEKHFPGGFDLARQSQHRRAQDRVRLRRTDLLRRAQEWLVTQGAVTGRELDAAVLPHKEDLSWLHAQVAGRLVRGSSTGVVFTDEDLISALRSAGRAVPGRLTTKAYDRVRQSGWPSSALIVHRIGWAKAVERAGMEPNKAQRLYERKWYPSTILEWVARFRREVPAGSSLAYDHWQRQHDQAPSLATVSLVMGGWNQAISQSLRGL